MLVPFSGFDERHSIDGNSRDEAFNDWRMSDFLQGSSCLKILALVMPRTWVVQDNSMLADSRQTASVYFSRLVFEFEAALISLSKKRDGVRTCSSTDT